MLTGSMVVFGTIGLFVKYIPLASSQVALSRALIASVIVGGFLLLRRKRPEVTALKKALPWLLLSGAAMGFNWILLFEAYKYTTVSKATLCYYLAPTLVTVLSALLFRERLGLKKILCFTASTLGIVLISGLGTDAGRNDLAGIAFGVGAACLYATVMLLNKHIHGVDGLWRTFAQFVASAIVLIPYVLLTDGFDLSGLLPRAWVLLLAVGIVHSGIAYCLYFSALKALPGQKSAILSYIDPLVAVLLSVLVLREAMPAWQLICGCALILGGAICNDL